MNSRSIVMIAGYLRSMADIAALSGGFVCGMLLVASVSEGGTSALFGETGVSTMAGLVAAMAYFVFAMAVFSPWEERCSLEARG